MFSERGWLLILLNWTKTMLMLKARPPTTLRLTLAVVGYIRACLLLKWWLKYSILSGKGKWGVLFSPVRLR
jgi:hypothetical protein